MIPIFHNQVELPYSQRCELRLLARRVFLGVWTGKKNHRVSLQTSTARRRQNATLRLPDVGEGKTAAKIFTQASSLLLALALWLTPEIASAITPPAMRLEITPVVNGEPLAKDMWQDERFAVTRLDYLLSTLALQHEDGSWLESEDWHGFLSLEKNRTRVEATGLPAKKFRAIRFDVGLHAKTNKSDPAQYAPDHPLHPELNGLHWGWQGGYVFMALEGRWTKEDGTPGGFSYHIANDENRMRVELPLDLRGGGPVTISISLDVGYLLRGIDFEVDGDATHSREGDPLAKRLATNVRSAFRVESISYDLFQTAPTTTDTAALPKGTKPHPLAITQRFPQAKLPADNPLTEEGVQLGERLFHDTRLSINNSQSCASCHDQRAAFTDTRRFSLGAEGQIGKRNAMPLFNLAWHDGFFWDGRAKTLREQVLMPVTDAHEMNESLDRVVDKLGADKTMASQFEHAFGSQGITTERMAKSLEQYLLTLLSQDSKFDQAARKLVTLTESEARGLQLFVTEFDPERGLRGADCFHCHGGTLFSNHKYANNGLYLAADDLGRMAVTGDAADHGKFKTPSLRNISATAPYMHDGRFATLEEVVEHYSSGVARTATLDPNLAKHPEAGIQLTTQEKTDLVAFLKTLTDETFINAKNANTRNPKLASQP
jgi:cytochrome c peroxidase